MKLTSSIQQAGALRTLITLVLLVHDVGHLMGAMPALGLFDDERRSGQGWLKN